MNRSELILNVLSPEFTVCQPADFSQCDLTRPFTFTARTDEELSLVCPIEFAPANTVRRDDGWRAFRVQGVLDFSLIGILADIANVLAENRISLFAVSTYNTDYVLTKSDVFERALTVLAQAGYTIR